MAANLGSQKPNSTAQNTLTGNSRIMFITQYSAEYGLIMAASVVALIPVLIVFLSLQKYFVQGVASTGIKG